MEVFAQVSSDTCILACLQVEIHDGEFTLPSLLHIGKERRGEYMDSAEGIFMVFVWIHCKSFGFGLPCTLVYPSAKIFVLVEKQVTCGLSATGKQGSLVAAVKMIFVQCFQIGIRKDIYIVYQEGFFSGKERRSL